MCLLLQIKWVLNVLQSKFHVPSVNSRLGLKFSLSYLSIFSRNQKSPSLKPDLFSDAGGPLSRRRRAPFPSSLFSALLLSPCLSRPCYWSWAESVLWRSDSLVRAVSLSGYLSGTGAVGREALWVGVDSFSRLHRSLRSVPSGFGVLVSVLGSLVVRWAKLALTFGDPTACSKWCAQVGKELSIELGDLLWQLVSSNDCIRVLLGSFFLGQAQSGSGSLLILFHNKCVELSTCLAALLESLVKWVYTVSGWLVGGSNLQLSFPNDGIAGLGPALCCRRDTSWVWVAFLSGSSRQPVPAPLTPVPLGLSRA
ncbi:hypothetical protein DY000_02015311 [Brassica cretica]|uniref:Uncharacterized protein n=1 Tax=Brassica cretica TaxID=69181 RepID=A0ABQ7D3G5_BRACR|nr:hypothetical protein DY000_02015311 [Brassica cretica]